jgi:nitrogen fixation protein NifQ
MLRDRLAGLSAAEQFFETLGVAYDPAVVDVSRLHILKRFGDLAGRGGADPSEDFCRQALARAYGEFADGRGAKRFKVFERQAPVRVPLSGLLGAGPPPVAAPTPDEVYALLMAVENPVEAADRHVLASAIAKAAGERPAPITQALGLERSALAALLDVCFPGALDLDGLVAVDAGAGADALEEPDFRRLLLQGRSRGAAIEEWLARIVVRRSLKPHHLWCSLGLRNRQELSLMLHRHFESLAARNVKGMRWKKFFYREMCQAEGIFVCKSPVCDSCSDHSECFGPEHDA